MENPNHCGGYGGCVGATVELAFDYVVKHGLPTINEEPYQGVSSSCQSQLASPVTFMDGYTKLPENEYAPVLQALYQHGPIGASVSARPWHYYLSGIFDGCAKDAVLGHAVLLMGYDQDKSYDSKPKYWQSRTRPKENQA